MSCLNGTDCNEFGKRRVALAVLTLMLIIFLVLSVWSFLPSRGQVTPEGIQFGQQDAIQGKRVFQAYNCMGCHTIVGNGAYLGPDLTDIYTDTGPAWLAAFLPSAAGWPTETAVQVQLQNATIQEAAGTKDMQAYRRQYVGAAERMDHRGGQHTLMPNLPLTADEIQALVAFFKYTGSMNNEGWPPKPHPDRKIPVGMSVAKQTAQPMALAVATTAAAAVAQATDQPSEAATEADLAALGKKLVADMGCVACHATDKKRSVGPGWGGLYGSEVELTDGSKHKVDDAYLEESIRQPDAKVAAGYPAHVMPSYDAMINESDMQAILAYLRSL